MSSKLKSDTARTNGAKSHGPHTPEGRARSSANSRTHGLAAKYLLLPNDSDEHFQLLHDDYLDQFQPQTGVETDLVEIMVIARWRLRLLLTIESNLFDIEIARREKQIDAKLNNMDGDARLAWVFQHMADHGHSIAMMIRYEGSINRSYDKALKQLLLLQSRRPAPPPPPVNTKIQNEPNPDPDELRPRLSEPRPSGSALSLPRPEGAVTNPESATPRPRPSEPRPNEPLPEGAVTNPESATLQPDELRPNEPRPQEVESLTSADSPVKPKPSKTPIQPPKPTPNVNPTIPVLDSVS